MVQFGSITAKRVYNDKSALKIEFQAKDDSKHAHKAELGSWVDSAGNGVVVIDKLAINKMEFKKGVLAEREFLHTTSPEDRHPKTLRNKEDVLRAHDFISALAFNKTTVNETEFSLKEVKSELLKGINSRMFRNTLDLLNEIPKADVKPELIKDVARRTVREILDFFS